MRARTFSILFLLCWASTAVGAQGAQPSDLLYVWAWDKDEQQSDFLAVVDVDGGSPTYGQVVSSIAVGVVGYAHHVEHQRKDPEQLFVNSFAAGRSFVIDPSAPRVLPGGEHNTSGANATYELMAGVRFLVEHLEP